MLAKRQPGTCSWVGGGIEGQVPTLAGLILHSHVLSLQYAGRLGLAVGENEAATCLFAKQAAARILPILFCQRLQICSLCTFIKAQLSPGCFTGGADPLGTA